jgi:hypothetical protein
MPPKRRVKATRGKTKAIAQDLPVPDFTPLLNLMDFNKLDRILEKTLAKHFYNELETAMNELVEQKQRFKGIVSTYLGENKVFLQKKLKWDNHQKKFGWDILYFDLIVGL